MYRNKIPCERYRKSPKSMIMTNDCLVLLQWAVENGDRYVSLHIIAEETNIPQESIRCILHDAQRWKDHSLLYGVACNAGYEYHIFREWNIENRWKHRKKIIDAYKSSEPMYKEQDWAQKEREFKLRLRD